MAAKTVELSIWPVLTDVQLKIFLDLASGGIIVLCLGWVFESHRPS